MVYDKNIFNWDNCVATKAKIRVGNDVDDI